MNASTFTGCDKAEPVSPEKLGSIDALRGLAAIYVVICHVGFIPHPDLTLPTLGARFVEAGHTGVILFFLISSFTLCLSSAKRNTEKNHHAKFYLRRLFRILPLFYFSVLLACARDYHLNGITPSWSTITSSIAGVFIPGKTDNIVWGSWTLGIELIFYLIFPFLFAWANSLWRTVYIFVIMASADLIAVRLILQGQDVKLHPIRFGLLHNIPFFIIGLIFYYVYRYLYEERIHARMLGYAIISISGGLFLGLLIFFPKSLTNLSTHGHYLVAASMLLLMVGLLIHPTRIIVNSMTIYWGQISYSLYLLHPPLVYLLIPVYRFFYGHTPWPVIAYILSLFLTLCILIPFAVVSYKFIEAPGIKLGSLISRRYL